MANDAKDNNEKIRIGEQLIGIREIHGVYQRGADVFKYRFPTPAERAKIESQISRAIGGVPIESFNQNEYATVRICAYLDGILVQTPDWWKGASSCMDEPLLMEIFTKFYEDQENFRRRLREGKFPRVGAGAPA